MLDSPSQGSCFRKMSPWKNWLYRLVGLGYRRAGENIDSTLKEYTDIIHNGERKVIFSKIRNKTRCPHSLLLFSIV